VLLAIFGCSEISSAKAVRVSYGRWQTYSAAEPLVYPDLTVRFTGYGPQNIDSGVPMGQVFQFLVSDGTSETTVSWSMGTGDIGPELFEIGSKRFFLEMVRSDHLRERAQSEQQIVIWPESEFLRRKSSWSLW
jgi:hypothetical protein